MTSPHSRGFVALISVLIFGAIATAISLASVLGSIDSSRSSFAEAESAKARALAVACAETALMGLSESPDATAPGELSLNGNDCTYTITEEAEDARIIQAISTVNSFFARVSVEVSSTSPMLLTSWEETTY
jgi:hypothetical protein